MDRNLLVSLAVWTVVVGALVAYVALVLVSETPVTFFGVFVYVVVVATLTGFGILPRPPFVDRLRS
ncbi:hypothetical protein VB773_04525 [Haloarculaceae archaeon H-GB2-1]|nr:hypothetical protein [Haloarculaceae archaeon H-GB1-1]MEA5388861.1 hypothetical protein [Haloarculaceae archaeon H-GB11]MEA5406917.1 hypothetical protein [Haloarculaceae archaeon H-GB2-1]